MSHPTAVFLDTSILAGQQYNFTSAALATFIPVAKEKKLPLLLPNPTQREIMRQTSERSIAALRALEEARRKAPFLSKWQHFPKLPDSRYGDWEVKRVAMDEWKAFLKQFAVVELGYEAVRIETVMSWYENVRAPFGQGKKRKEFPDAFAIAALAAYGKKTATYIAVVSEDPDFKAACDHFPYLLYFPSLPVLTELLLGTDKAVEEARTLVLANQDLLESAIADEADALSFYHSNSMYKDIDETDIDYVSVEEICIVGMGDLDCTITFDSHMEYSVKLRWTEYLDYDEEPVDEIKWVHSDTPITGIAKLRIKDDHSGIECITLIELDDSEIEVIKEP
jgi:hypothetical protein